MTEKMNSREATEYFTSQDFGEGVELMWVDEVDGAPHWLNNATGEIVPAAEHEIPAGAPRH